ncbi:MAG TPA: hypothetical protein VFD27_09040 [Chthoniobacteraceae bacterium]|jgi:hypothetical protein|nr:hypothetical protein [Chthoniobacteraceae bacterium]
MRLPATYYYLRVYPDGRAAIWPSPPDGATSWTKLSGDSLEFGYQRPLNNPRLSRRGALLVMHNDNGSDVFDRTPHEIEPPK